jgi:hypothetical protein
MTYRYDRRSLTASSSTLLSLIVKAALADRRVDALISAYIEDLYEDWLLETEDESDYDAFQKDLQILDEASVERLWNKVYVQAYRALVPGTSTEEALEVQQWPQHLTHKNLPAKVVIEIATALAKQDGVDARALRREYLRRHPA